MNNLVHDAVERVRILRNRVYRVIEKTFHHNDSAVGYFIGPFVYMVDQRADDALRAKNFFYIVMWFGKEFSQPVFAADCAGKIEFMKNGKLLFLVKDRYVAE